MRRGLRVIVVGVLAACDGGLSAPAERQPLQPGTWHVHAAEGQALPALVGHAIVGGTLQQTFLDSATIAVSANGQWEQKAYARTWENLHVIEALTRVDHGSVAETDSGYVLVSAQYGPRHFIPLATSDSLKLLLRVDGIPGVAVSTLRRQPPAAGPVGTWRAASVNGSAVPGRLYLFDPTELYGQEVSVHFIVDSAKIALHPTGRYTHQIWVGHWVGEVGGPPLARTLGLFHGDHGAWTRTGAVLEFESQWLQNHRMTGSYGSDGVLRMEHGFSHGDETAPFAYAH
jgi:hypothetical protein